MPVTREEIAEFFERNWKSLKSLAQKRLPRSQQDHAEDVVADAALAVCRNASCIEDLGKYASSCVFHLCKHFFEQPPEQLCEWLPTTPATQESRLIEREEERLRIDRRREILAGLPEVHQRNYLEWEDRGFHADTHSERCKASRVRTAIAAASGATVAKYMHVTHRGWDATVNP